MKSYIRRAVQILLQFFAMALLLFGASGDPGWLWGWSYFAFALVNLAINFLVFPEEIVAARSEVHRDIPRWEQIVTRVLLVFTLGLFCTAGLDHRFHGSPVLVPVVHMAALLVMAMGSFLSTRAIVSNRFFATQVRIQTERGHTVQQGGPYAWIRHPGYAGFILTWLPLPVLFGTLWALIPAAGIAILFVIRAGFEDAFLQKNLPGYAEYATRVRWRLIPGIW